MRECGLERFITILNFMTIRGQRPCNPFYLLAWILLSFSQRRCGLITQLFHYCICWGLSVRQHAFYQCIFLISSEIKTLLKWKPWRSYFIINRPIKHLSKINAKILADRKVGTRWLSRLISSIGLWHPFVTIELQLFAEYLQAKHSTVENKYRLYYETIHFIQRSYVTSAILNIRIA